MTLPRGNCLETRYSRAGEAFQARYAFRGDWREILNGSGWSLIGLEPDYLNSELDWTVPNLVHNYFHWVMGSYRLVYKYRPLNRNMLDLTLLTGLKQFRN